MESDSVQTWAVLEIASLRHLKCFDPRDRVFSVIHLLGAHNKSQIKVNYTQSTEQVFTNASWSMIQECHNLDPICFHTIPLSGQLSASRLHSWVRDWRLLNQGLSLTQYRASLTTVPEISLSDDSTTLSARGRFIDTVSASAYENVPEEPAGIAQWACQAAGLALWNSDFKTYPTLCDPIDAWIRCVLGDVVENEDGSWERIDGETLHKARQLFTGTKADDSHNEVFLKVLNTGLLLQIERMARSCKFFISSSGYMGMATQDLQKGDAICILLGCHVPMLIRKQGDYHHLVGECFVWGLMDGEGLQDRKDEEFEIFRLR